MQSLRKNEEVEKKEHHISRGKKGSGKGKKLSKRRVITLHCLGKSSKRNPAREGSERKGWRCCHQEKENLDAKFSREGSNGRKK